MRLWNQGAPAIVYPAALSYASFASSFALATWSALRSHRRRPGSSDDGV